MLKWALFWGLALYLTAVAALYFAQRKLLYFPTPAVEHGLQVQWLEQDASRLEVIVLNPGREKAIIYFGGNAESVADNAPLFQQQLAESSVYLLNYRGYGASTGSATEQALLADAVALYDAVSVKHSSISLIGRSLGTGVAVYLAGERDIDRLLLVTAYDSIAAVAQSHYPYFPVRWLIKDSFDSLSRASKLTAKTLLVLAENDEVIVRARSEALLAALPEAELWLAEGAGHNNVTEHHEYNDRLRQFFYEK